MPSLIQLEKQAEKPYETKLFKGFKGFKTAIYEALDELAPKDEILGMGILVKKRSEKFNIMWKQWHKIRIKRKIKCKVIFSEDKSDYYKYFKKMKLIEVKALKGITPTAVDVMNDRVLILTHGKEPSCLSIKNPEIAQSFRVFFNSLWKTAKK